MAASWVGLVPQAGATGRNGHAAAAWVAPAGLAAYGPQLASLHSHVCPRQVLGLRMGLLAGEALGCALPQADKRLVTISETDGCFADGLMVVTGCSVGHRTLRVVDYGKVAATFVDTRTERALRIVPRPGVRELAARYAPEAPSRWHAQRDGYGCMPAEALFTLAEVQLTVSCAVLVGRMGPPILCADCGEEVINQRFSEVNGRRLCRGCAGDGYVQRRAANPPADGGLGSAPAAD